MLGWHAFLEKYDWLGLNESYYASEHIEDAFELREVLKDESFEKRELILRKFVQFTFLMHQNGIEFLDHSPGNTLIKKTADTQYNFYLVDLNRMNFHDKMDFDSRMKNLSRLTPKKEMIAVMSDEYAKQYAQSSDLVFEKMWQATNDFQEKFKTDLVIIGISDQTKDVIVNFNAPKIEYFSAIDTKKVLKNLYEVVGIPHCVLIDPKGIVRWEGYPSLEGHELTEKVINDIISKYKYII